MDTTSRTGCKQSVNSHIAPTGDRHARVLIDPTLNRLSMNMMLTDIETETSTTGSEDAPSARVAKSRSQADGGACHVADERVLDLVWGMYHEMPGLQLTLAQASRLFALDKETCCLALERLVSSGQLRRREDGQYVWNR